MRRVGRDGRRSEPPPGGIELLAPNSSAFSTSSADGFVDVADERPVDFDGSEEPRSPRVTLATAAGVFALVAATVIAAAPWHEDDAAVPAARPGTSTTVPDGSRSTVPPETTASEAIDAGATALRVARPGYVAAERPEGFEVSGLFTSSAAPSLGWLEVWAEPGSSRHEGRWFAVQVNEAPMEPVVADAERVPLGRNGIALLTHTSDEIAVLRLALAHDTSATITAGGWTDVEIGALAAAMGHVGLRPVVGRTFVDDLDLVWAAPAAGRTIDEVVAYGSARTGLKYRRGPDDFITISAVDADPALDGLTRFVLTEPPEFAVSAPSVRAQLSGRRVTAGMVPGLDDARLAQWVEGDDLVTIVTNLRMGPLLDVAATVRAASADDWVAAMIEARGFRGSSSLGAPRHTIGEGELGDGTPWRVALVASGVIAVIDTPSGAVTHELGSREPLHVVASQDATIVIARTPPKSGSGSLLRVVTATGTVDVPLRAEGPTRAMAAAFAFGEIGDFSAAVVAADGTTVAVLPGEEDVSRVVTLFREILG